MSDWSLEPSSARGTLPRVVVVDDDPDVVDRLTQLLGEDYDVEATTDWGRLSSLVFRAGVDLVLMDVNLPVLRGDQLVGILGRAGAGGAKRPRIIYYSSEDEETMRRLVAETGADGYLSKSARTTELLAAIEALLQR